MAKIEQMQEVAVEKLRPYANNAKQHSPEQVEKIANSIEEFGFLSPCIIDKDFNIIAGHGRVMAAMQIGRETVPCVFVEGLTEAQRKAYVLADNRLTELGAWDMDIVSSELEELKALDFDIDLTGFDFSSSNYIDDLYENGLQGSKVDTEEFSITFVINKQYQDAFDLYIRQIGKQSLVDILIEEVQNA